MNKDNLESMRNLLNATSDLALTHKENFKTVETEINKLKGNLEASRTINNILIGTLAAASPEFKEYLKSALEEMLSSKMKLPGDFANQAKKILAVVCGAPVQVSRIVPLRLLDGGKGRKKIE
jgi:hypothetical protein